MRCASCGCRMASGEWKIEDVQIRRHRGREHRATVTLTLRKPNKGLEHREFEVFPREGMVEFKRAAVRKQDDLKGEVELYGWNEDHEDLYDIFEFELDPFSGEVSQEKELLKAKRQRLRQGGKMKEPDKKELRDVDSRIIEDLIEDQSEMGKHLPDLYDVEIEGFGDAELAYIEEDGFFLADRGDRQAEGHAGSPQEAVRKIHEGEATFV